MWDLDLALRCVRRAVDLSADRPEYDYYLLLAQVHYEREELGEAIAAVERMIPLSPTSKRAKDQSTPEQLRELRESSKGGEQ